MREYDSIAEWYPTNRSRIFGVAEALAVATLLPAHSRILDVGCGNGIPITEALVMLVIASLVSTALQGCSPGFGSISRRRQFCAVTLGVFLSQMAASTLRFRGG